MKELEYQKEYLKHLKELSNQELVEEVICSAQGDDYDGCFTQKGAWEFGEVKKELSLRLISCGFITDSLFTERTLTDEEV